MNTVKKYFLFKIIFLLLFQCTDIKKFKKIKNIYNKKISTLISNTGLNFNF
jgi:uncharacterized membrane protein